MQFAAATNKSPAFTLVEVLAALLLMAIVIPVAMEALHTATAAGMVGVRKGEAARVADRILNESIVSTNWNQFSTGTTMENGHQYRWTLRNETWSADSAMQLLTAEVQFSTQGRESAVHLSTLVPGQSINTLTSVQ